MFKPLAAAFALSIAATPLMADQSAPGGFGADLSRALDYLTLGSSATALTRDAQVGEGPFDASLAAAPAVRSHAASQRARVFSPAKSAAERSVDGFRGFGRIDR